VLFYLFFFDGKRLIDDLFLWPFFKLHDARRIHKGLKEKAIIIQLTCLLLCFFCGLVWRPRLQSYCNGIQLETP
jgi:hypothetical protein